MRHPSDGTLRRLVDDPAGVPDTDREHVARCPVCHAGLASAEADAARTGAALGAVPTPDVDRGWDRLVHAVAEQRPAAPAAGRSGRRRAALPAVVAVGVAALLTGASAAAAANWLQIFRAERIVPATLSEAELVALPDLSDFGEVEVLAEPGVRAVADAAAAAEATGLDVPQVDDLPRGVSGEPSFRVGDEASVVFTFSTDEAAEVAAAQGEELPDPPAGLDGSRFRLVAGPGVAAVWSQSRGAPALVVGRAVAPSAYSSGVPFETAKEYLLSLPGIPADVAAQLDGFSGDGTLPLPVPGEELDSSPAEVGGAPATVLTSRDGLLAGVVWVRGGVVTAVAGSLGVDEVLAVAGGLR